MTRLSGTLLGVKQLSGSGPFLSEPDMLNKPELDPDPTQICLDIIEKKCIFLRNLNM